MEQVTVSTDELALAINNLNAGIMPTASIENLASIIKLMDTTSAMLEAFKIQKDAGGLSIDSVREVQKLIDPVIDFIKALPKIAEEFKTLDQASMITVAIQTFYAGKRLAEAAGALMKKA